MPAITRAIALIVGSAFRADGAPQAMLRSIRDTIANWRPPRIKRNGLCITRVSTNGFRPSIESEARRQDGCKDPETGRTGATGAHMSEQPLIFLIDCSLSNALVGAMAHRKHGAQEKTT